MRLVLIRDYSRSDCTLGFLIVGGRVFHTLERPWLDNRKNASCIPTGSYQGAYLQRSRSGRYKDVWHVRDVPGRSGILIHHGNLVEHTRGCILVGMRRGRLKGQRAVLNSRSAMAELREIIGEKTMVLDIQEVRNDVAS